MESNFYSDFFKPLIQDYGLLGFLILIIFILIFFPEKTKIWKGWIAYAFSFLIQSCRKPAIKGTVEGNCNIAIKKVARDITGIEMPKMLIEWVKQDNFLSKLKSGEAIVSLKFSSDISENIVKAASIYVKTRILPTAKLYMNAPLRSAIDLNIIRKILLSIDKDRDQIINSFFYENENELNETREKSTQIQTIDDAGLFNRILIREYDFFGGKLYGLTPTPKYKEEADRFLNYLLDISSRQYDDSTPLQFEGEILKVGILLVARIETYQQYGLDAYLRRIKRGLVKGIKTFYLLAREDKVPILEEVAAKLLDTGNFILVNKPKEFLDHKNRTAICFCLRVDSSSAIAKAYERIASALDEHSMIEGIIVKIRYDGLKVDIDGVEGFVRKANLSNTLIENIGIYFKEGTSIEMIPIEKNADGVVEFSLIGTKSDPQKFIESSFTIGKTINAEVVDYGDEIVYFNTGSDLISATAIRRNLTYSRFEFLHKLFPLGSKHNLTITEINFERNQIYLRLQDLKDPWSLLNLRMGQDIDILICLKNDRCFIGETSTGVEVVLPHRELAWFAGDIETKKKMIKLNSTITCRIIYINKDSRNLFVSIKERESNPYKEYLHLYQHEKVYANLVDADKNGVYGTVDDKYNLYIPKSELSWEHTAMPNYKLNKKNIVEIIDINKKNDCLIGSLKFKIEHPLKQFADAFPVGYRFSTLGLDKVYQWGALANVTLKNKKYEILIFRGDIIDGCYVNSAEEVFKNISSLPITIKEIDFAKQRIIGSLKITLDNNDSNSITYDDSFDAIIVGENKAGNYIIIILEKWVKGILETTTKYPIGKSLRVRPSLLGSPTIFTED